VEQELAEKRAALAEVSKATEEQELQFAHSRDKVLVHIAKTDLAVYQRIRKARKGKAVVSVSRNACGGCFARVPPQKILELRRNDRIFTCEHCGRILVSDDIVEAAAKDL
jgi:predicted  nucleic acid-binding Zn-ribbon protein